MEQIFLTCPDKALGFLHALYPTGRILCAIHAKTKAIEHVYSLDPKAQGWLEKHAGQWNIYFQIGEAKAPSDHPRKLKGIDVQSLPCFWVDIDNFTDVAEVQRAILTAGIPGPSRMTLSGGGIWVFWDLEEPFELESVLDMAQASDTMRGLAHLIREEINFGEDNVEAKVDRCYDVSWMSRIPYMPNANRNGVVAGPLEASGMTYSFDDFDDIEQAGILSKPPASDHDVPRGLDDLEPSEDYTKEKLIAKASLAPKRVKELSAKMTGDRNGGAVSMAMAFILAGVPDDWIMAALFDKEWGSAEHVWKSDQSDHNRAARRAIKRAHAYLANAPHLDPAKPNRAARLYAVCNPHQFFMGKLLYVWKDTHYVGLEPEEQLVLVRTWLLTTRNHFEEPIDPNVALVREVHAALKAVLPTREKLVAPCTLDGVHQRGFVAFANGVYDSRSGRFGSHTPDLFVTGTLPFDYSEDAKCPNFDQRVFEWFGGDKATGYVSGQQRTPGELRFLEMVGYIMSGDRDLPYMFCFAESGGTAKSFITSELLPEMVGRNNFDQTSSESLEERYGAAVFEHNRYVLMPEENSAFGAKAWKTIKKVTGGDALGIRRMHVAEYSAISPSVVITTGNESFSPYDDEDAVRRRVRFIPMRKDLFFGTLEEVKVKRDEGKDAVVKILASDLMDELRPEFPGIVLATLKAYEERRKVGKDLTATEEATERQDDMISEQTAAVRFMTERFKMTGDVQNLEHQYDEHAVHEIFVGWAKLQGIREEKIPGLGSFRSAINRLSGVSSGRKRCSGEFYYAVAGVQSLGKFQVAESVSSTQGTGVSPHLVEDAIEALETIADQKPNWVKIRSKMPPSLKVVK